MGSIREGLSADMLVPLREVLLTLIPSYLISLNDEGELGVKILIDTKVKFSKYSNCRGYSGWSLGNRIA